MATKKTPDRNRDSKGHYTSPECDHAEAELVEEIANEVVAEAKQNALGLQSSIRIKVAAAYAGNLVSTKKSPDDAVVGSVADGTVLEATESGDWYKTSAGYLPKSKAERICPAAEILSENS